jgi:Gamma interferon inducible lysosomal thiol reductase (GILT)
MVLAAWTFASSLLPRLTTSNTSYDGGYQQNSILGDGHVSQITGANKTRHVSLEAHIMSKCPDAKACLQELVIPAMEKVSDKVDFNLSFIGRCVSFSLPPFFAFGFYLNEAHLPCLACSVDNHSDSVTCEHGPSECLGNLILLCAEQLYPDPKLSLGFANCMIDDYRDIPQRGLVESCAMEHGIDFKKINNCISDEGRAQDMLRDSVERSAEAQVSTSCTIRLNGKVWCVTDEKKDCNDGANLDGLVKDIKNAYDELN